MMGFWRSWHRSYNLWTVRYVSSIHPSIHLQHTSGCADTCTGFRYIYVPVGGGQNVIVATLLVFTFVALWHDLSMRLLMWGWLISLFFLPELSARRIFNEKQVSLPLIKYDPVFLTRLPGQYGDYWWYRHLCALGAVGNMLMLMAANLVGFAIGVDGIKYLLSQLTGSLQGLACFTFPKQHVDSPVLFRSQLPSYSVCLLVYCCASYVRVSVSPLIFIRELDVHGIHREEEMRQGVYRKC